MALDIKKIVERLKKEQREEKKHIRQKIDNAYREVNRLKDDFLREDPKMRKLILFGSLAEERVSSLDFDIDLAVDSDNYLRLLSLVLKSPFRVDLVDLSNVREHIQKEIELYGKVIYEKKR